MGHNLAPYLALHEVIVDREVDVLSARDAKRIRRVHSLLRVAEPAGIAEVTRQVVVVLPPVGVILEDAEQAHPSGEDGLDLGGGEVLGSLVRAAADGSCEVAAHDAVLVVVEGGHEVGGHELRRAVAGEAVAVGVARAHEEPHPFVEAHHVALGERVVGLEGVEGGQSGGALAAVHRARIVLGARAARVAVHADAVEGVLGEPGEVGDLGVGVVSVHPPLAGLPQVGQVGLGGGAEEPGRHVGGHALLGLDGVDESRVGGAAIIAVAGAQARVGAVAAVEVLLDGADLGVASGEELVLVDAQDGLHRHGPDRGVGEDRHAGVGNDAPHGEPRRPVVDARDLAGVVPLGEKPVLDDLHLVARVPDGDAVRVARRLGLLPEHARDRAHAELDLERRDERGGRGRAGKARLLDALVARPAAVRGVQPLLGFENFC